MGVQVGGLDVVTLLGAIGQRNAILLFVQVACFHSQG